jgi:hypothetical protein
MSADAVNQNNTLTEQLPVWTIHGSNWQVDVPLTEFNAQFDMETQAMEAATQAMMAYKNLNAKLQIKLDDGETIPYLGPTMIAHLQGTDPTQGLVPFTHMVLANEGFYKEAYAMRLLFEQQIEAIKQDQIKTEKAVIALDAAIKSLNKLSKKKVPRRKKLPPPDGK